MLSGFRIFQGQGAVLLLMLFALSACSTGYYGRSPANNPAASPHYKVGKPYRVKDKTYRPAEDPDYDAYGIASWYGRDFHGKKTANGEQFDMNRLSAAHTTLPMPSLVEVTNVSNGRRLVVRVNDRGPFADNRIIDLSRAAARKLGFERKGLARVRVRYVGRAPLYAKAPKNQRLASQRPTHQRPTYQRLVDSPSDELLMQTTRATTRRATTKFVFGEAKRSASRLVTPTLVSASDNTTLSVSKIRPTNAIRSSASPVLLAPNPKPVAAIAPASAAYSSSNPATSSLPSNAALKSRPGPLYLIRVAALSSLDNIEALKAQLRGIGQLRLSRTQTSTGSVLYRINMGPFASVEIANKRLEAVRDAGYKDAGLITLNP